MTFTPTETFQCEETGNWYCKGLLYTVRDQDLAERVSVWLNAGVVVQAKNGATVSLSGEGKVI